MINHPVAKKIVELLQSNNYWFETFEHEEVRTSEEAAKVRTGYVLNQGAKAIILRIKQNGEKKFVMLVLSGKDRFDKEKVMNQLQTKDIRFATEEEVVKITNGVLPGGIPPFGNLFSLPVYVDSKLLINEKIIFNAGDRGFSVAMKSKDYVNLVQPIIEDIV